MSEITTLNLTSVSPEFRIEMHVLDSIQYPGSIAKPQRIESLNLIQGLLNLPETLNQACAGLDPVFRDSVLLMCSGFKGFEFELNLPSN